MLLRLYISNHSSHFSAFLQADQVPQTTLKGNDATLFAVFKPFIFVVVCLSCFCFLIHCKELMCLSILPNCGCITGGVQLQT